MRCPLQITVIILSVASGIHCDPKLLEVRYPIFYLSPRVGPRANMVEKLAIIPNPRQEPGQPPMITNRLTVATDPETSDEEVTHFHSQDAKGKFIFGFHVPNQVRMESRDHDGTVRGSYSYVDPFGNIIKMQYWDDGYGFHTAGNNIPKTAFLPPQYTPEVQAARDEHFKLYQQALAASSADSDEEDKDDDSSSDSDSEPDTDVAPEEHENHQEGTIVIGEDDSSDDEPDSFESHNSYPYLKFPFEKDIITPNHIVDDDSESVAIDNPELSFRSAPGDNFWFRRRKSFDLDRESESESEPESESNEEDTSKSESTETRLRNGFPPVSFLAAKAGSVPVAAVHDVQTSPFQRATVDSHQLLPVFSGHSIAE